jgi:hypothetical protein
MARAAELPFPQRDQPLLMPVDMREWLPEDDLVSVVLDAVAALDLGGFSRRYLTIEIQAGAHTVTAADPLPGALRDARGRCLQRRRARLTQR